MQSEKEKPEEKSAKEQEAKFRERSARERLPEPFYNGKIRKLYSVDDFRLILLTTDRISAFDVVFNETVPSKGIILNHISSLWCRAIKNAGLPDKYGFGLDWLSDDISQFPQPFSHFSQLAGRSVLVKRAHRIDFECIVRGYLAGSAWKEYQSSGTVGGQKLISGLRAGEKLPHPIFTPTTKAAVGAHDENISLPDFRQTLGKELSCDLERISLELYQFAAQLLAPADILLADTKFEFGLPLYPIKGERLLLIDEVLTPDSSRFWRSSDYAPGKMPPGFDKQHIRDFAEQSGWNKKPPPPTLPTAVLKRTESLYKEIERRIEKALASKLRREA